MRLQGNRIDMPYNTSQSAQNLHTSSESLRLGETYHLGMLIATFKPHYSRSGAAFFYSQVLFLVFALAILITAFILYFSNYTHNVIWLFFLIIVLNSFNILNVTRRKNKGQPIISPFEQHRRIYVYQNGLISIRSKQPVVMRWEQVRQVRYIRPKTLYGRTATITIVYSDRGATKRIGIANVLTNADMDSLGTLLEQMYATWKANME